MTTKYKMITTNVSKKVFESSVCDWCGMSLPEEYGNTRFDRRSFNLEFLEGSGSSDGGYMEGWQVEDLCNPCVTKLRKLLEDADVKVSDHERDW